MTNMKTKVGRCEGGGQPPLPRSSEDMPFRCPVCTASPKLNAKGMVKSHEKKSPRT